RVIDAEGNRGGDHQQRNLDSRHGTERISRRIAPQMRVVRASHPAAAHVSLAADSMRSCPHCLSPYAADVEFCGIDGTKLVVVDVDPLLGKEIDRYRIIERIGDGAMARVYRATHKVLDLEYAVKVLLGEIASDKKLSERFRREAQVISKLSHVNI